MGRQCKMTTYILMMASRKYRKVKGDDMKALKHKETGVIYIPYYKIVSDVTGEMKPYLTNENIDICMTEQILASCEEIEIDIQEFPELLNRLPVKERISKTGDMIIDAGRVFTAYVYKISEEQQKEYDLIYNVRYKMASPLFRYGAISGGLRAE